MEKNSTDLQKKETAEAAEKAAKAGIMNRLFVKVGQKVGVVEWTKLDPNFESNIGKLIAYHRIVFQIVDMCEAQIQLDPNVLQNGKIEHPKEESPWELIGGWLNCLATYHFDGGTSRALERYSGAIGKIAAKERISQKKSRNQLIRKMRLYTSGESEKLNENYAHIKSLLHGIDDTRHHLKSAQTNKEVKERGEAYKKMIFAFNDKSSEIQGCIDEVTSIVKLHQMEFMKFAREMMSFNNIVDNTLNETRIRLATATERK